MTFPPAIVVLANAGAAISISNIAKIPRIWRIYLPHPDEERLAASCHFCFAAIIAFAGMNATA
jgi:hypothetical protein